LFGFLALTMGEDIESDGDEDAGSFLFNKYSFNMNINLIRF
jgi:hypothetical protein